MNIGGIYRSLRKHGVVRHAVVAAVVIRRHETLVPPEPMGSVPREYVAERRRRQACVEGPWRRPSRQRNGHLPCLLLRDIREPSGGPPCEVLGILENFHNDVRTEGH